MVFHTVPVQNGRAGVSKNYEPDARYRYRRNSYTSGEVDALLDGKAGVDDVYTKAESDGLLDLKADKSDTYTKTEVDTLVDDAGGEKQVVTVSSTSYVISESDKGKWLRFTSSDPVFVVWPVDAEFSLGNEVELFRVGEGPVTVFSEWAQDVRFNGKDDFRLNAKFSQVRAVNGDVSEWDCTYSGDVVFGVYQSPYYISDPGSDPSPIPWTPAEITTALWLDSSGSATITESSGSVSEWADKSGNDNHAVGAGSLSPQVGVDGIRFDSDLFTIADDATLQFGTGDFCVVYFCKFDNVSKGAAAQNTVISKNFTGFECFNYQGSINGYFGGTANAPGAISGLSNATYDIFSQVRLSSSAYLRRNGVAGSASTNSANVSQIGTSLIIGQRPGGNASQYFIGELLGVVILPSGYSVSDVQKVEGWGAWQYGIEGRLDASHPYKSSPPTL